MPRDLAAEPGQVSAQLWPNRGRLPLAESAVSWLILLQALMEKAVVLGLGVNKASASEALSGGSQQRASCPVRRGFEGDGGRVGREQVMQGHARWASDMRAHQQHWTEAVLSAY